MDPKRMAMAASLSGAPAGPAPAQEQATGGDPMSQVLAIVTEIKQMLEGLTQAEQPAQEAPGAVQQ